MPKPVETKEEEIVLEENEEGGGNNVLAVLKEQYSGHVKFFSSEQNGNLKVEVTGSTVELNDLLSKINQFTSKISRKELVYSFAILTDAHIKEIKLGTKHYSSLNQDNLNDLQNILLAKRAIETAIILHNRNPRNSSNTDVFKQFTIPVVPVRAASDSYNPRYSFSPVKSVIYTFESKEEEGFLLKPQKRQNDNTADFKEKEEKLIHDVKSFLEKDEIKEIITKRNYSYDVKIIVLHVCDAEGNNEPYILKITGGEVTDIITSNSGRPIPNQIKKYLTANTKIAPTLLFNAEYGLNNQYLALGVKPK